MLVEHILMSLFCVGQTPGLIQSDLAHSIRVKPLKSDNVGVLALSISSFEWYGSSIAPLYNYWYADGFARMVCV